MIHPGVLLLLHRWLNWVYFHRYGDLSLSQHVVRFSGLIQVRRNVPMSPLDFTATVK